MRRAGLFAVAAGMMTLSLSARGAETAGKSDNAGIVSEKPAAEGVKATEPSDAETSRLPLGVDAGVGFGLGSMSNSSNSIPGRTTDTFAMHVVPQFKYADFRIGPIFEYDFTGQLTDAASANQQNMKGHGWLFGMLAQYRWEKLLFSAGMDFLGNYTQTLVTVSGQSSSYTKPLGFRVGAGYCVLPFLSADVSMRMDWYGNNNLAGAPIDISSNHLKQTDYSIGVSYHY